MLTNIFNINVLKILTVISISRGSKFQRKELKERTRMNNAVLDTALVELVNSGILIRDKRHFFLNLENADAKQISDIALGQYKRLKELPFGVYFSIIDIASVLGKFKRIKAYLFGSYSKLVFKETSDIDIAIVSDCLREDRGVLAAMRKIEKRYKKPIELHYFSADFYKNKKDPLVKEILKNGVGLI